MREFITSQLKYLNRALVALIVLLLFSFIGLLGMGFGMAMDQNGNMTGCPFITAHMTICPMSLGEHIGRWQQIVTGIPQNAATIFFVVLAIYTSINFQILISKHESSFIVRMRVYMQKLHTLKLFDQLLRAFSNGNLNPKVFA